LTVLDRTGHMSPLERPDEVSGALRMLLAGFRGAPTAAARTEVAG
jgi:hypothetical protein